VFLSVAAGVLGPGCAAIKTSNGDPNRDAGGDTPTAMDGPAHVDLAPFEIAVRGEVGASGCGSGRVDTGEGERCDDGNSKSGDGCSADCKTIEPDFSCPLPGQPCVYQIKCGDAVRGLRDAFRCHEHGMDRVRDLDEVARA
jgi:cysteine-rich repeat protein